MADWTQIDLVKKHIQQSADYVAGSLVDFNMRWFRYAGLYDSPIEVVFSIWWRALSMAGHIDDGTVVLDSQREVELPNGRKYRVDFELMPTDAMQARAKAVGVSWPRIAIELDGHDFHERTKEQVAYRNKRDRDLQDAGWMVLHFSGSELVRDPAECVQQAFAAAYKAYGWDWEMEIVSREHDKAEAERAEA